MQQAYAKTRNVNFVFKQTLTFMFFSPTEQSKKIKILFTSCMLNIKLFAYWLLLKQPRKDPVKPIYMFKCKKGRARPIYTCLNAKIS